MKPLTTSIRQESKGDDQPKLLLDQPNDISVVGKCANCGVEYHIHQLEPQDRRYTLDELETMEGYWEKCRWNGETRMPLVPWLRSLDASKIDELLKG